MFIAALVTKGKKGKQPKWSTTDKSINEMWYMHTIEYYSALTEKEIPYATMQMNLKNIMLSEMSQTQRDKCCVRYLI